MTSELSLKIIELAKDDQFGEKVEFFLDDCVLQDPTNIDLWFRLAIAVIKPPTMDNEKAYSCLEKVLELDPQNPFALLALVHIHDRHDGISKELFERLEAYSTDSAEINSMIKFAQSWYYKDLNDLVTSEKLLRESIAFYQKHVWNYVELAELLLLQKRKDEISSLVQQALDNIVKIYEEDFHEGGFHLSWKPNDITRFYKYDKCSENYDYTDINEFINERIKGNSITKSNIEIIKDLLKL